ncbi:hypothetical protein ACFYQA_30885 [Streptomyces sp. NPDC005774]
MTSPAALYVTAVLLDPHTALPTDSATWNGQVGVAVQGAGVVRP